jgi:hypothetical protein
VYKDYTGEYEPAPEMIITITTEEDKLFVRLTGQPSFHMYPESESKFFLKVANAQIEFNPAENGGVEGLTPFQYGNGTFAKKKI